MRLAAALVVLSAFVGCAPLDEAGAVLPSWREGASALVGPELTVDSPITVPSRTYQFGEPVAVAFDGTQYLVVWFEQRAGFRKVIGARVRADGTLLDPLGFEICTHVGWQDQPRVASNGTGFLVTWQDGRAGDMDVYAGRVTATGTLLDPDGFPVATGAGAQQSPSVAFGGGTYLVAWSDGPTSAVRATRVLPDGTVPVPAGTQLAVAGLGVPRPVVAFGGGLFMVAWQDLVAGEQHILGGRLDTSAALLAPGVFAISDGPTAEQRPAIASDGTDFLVTWDDRRAGNQDVYGTPVSGAGVPQALGGIPIATGAGNQFPADVQYDGTQHWVTWTDGSSPPLAGIGARVLPNGTVLDGAGGVTLTPPIGADVWVPALGVGSGQLLVAWLDHRNYGAGSDKSALYASRATTAGALLDGTGFPVSNAANDQDAPASCTDANGQHWLVWTDIRSSAYGVYAARLDASGAVLAPGVQTLSPGTSQDRSVPRIACARSTALVVWNAGAQLEAIRLDPAGTPAGAAFGIGPIGAGRPDVATDGEDFLVVWDTGLDIQGARVGADGTVLDAGGFSVSAAANVQAMARVAWEGTRYRVVWHDQRAGGVDIYSTRVDSTGAVLDPAGVQIATGIGPRLAPVIAWGAGVSLVVWENLETPARFPEGVLIDSAQTITPVTGIAGLGEGRDTSAFAVAFDGTDFRLVWQETTPSLLAVLSDVRGTRITPTGGVREAPAEDLAGSGDTETAPALSSDLQGRSLLSYARFDSQPGVRSPRIRNRIVSTLVKGATCSADAECDNGLCVDGVCCDATCGGGDPTDCQACSIAAGAAQDGTCGPVTSGPFCSASTEPDPSCAGGSCGPHDPYRVGWACSAGPSGQGTWSALFGLALLALASRVRPFAAPLRVTAGKCGRRSRAPSAGARAG